jgi:HD-GYP domain-containing protein (c-di-GMP phosphodiesterase class II)
MLRVQEKVRSMNKMKSSLFDLIVCISDAVDLISPYLANHHRRVAYLSYQLARQYGLPNQRCKDLAIAASLHDVGALSLKERLDMLNFETERSLQHAELGYLLISGLKPFLKAADIVRFHHTYWDDGAGNESMGLPVPVESHILFLADRVSILINPREEVLSQVDNIVRQVERKSGSMFMPDVVDAFLELAEKNFIWFDLVSPTMDNAILRDLDWDVISLDGDELLDLAKFFCRIVDFKSPFTASHSSGVATAAQALAGMAGFSLLDQRLMYISGYMHDIGKLCVPSEIIEKPSALSSEESAVMRHHSYYTNHILQRVGVFDNIRTWSAYHHERLDGSGYPYHLKAIDLSEGARITAIADVFTAMMEDRPYRSGLQNQDGLREISEMAKKGLLDERLVGLLTSRFDEISALVLEAENLVGREYQEFIDRRTRYLEFSANRSSS